MFGIADMNLRRIRRRLSILSILVCSPAWADEATKQRFLREYPAASQFLLKRFEHVRCSFDSDKSSNGAPTSARFRRSGRYEKIETKRTGDARFSGEPIEEVIALRGRKPEFRIVRSGEEPNFVDLTQQGKVSNLSSLLARLRFRRNPGEAIRETIASGESWYWGMMNRYETIGSTVVYAPWGGDPGRIARWLDSGEASLVDAKDVDGEPGIVEIRFRKPEIHFMLDFVVRMDTNVHWAMKSMEVSTADTGEVHARMDVEYGRPIDGVAWPSRVTIDRGIDYRISGWDFEQTPKAEFYRSHYGLPDPPPEWGEPVILAILTLAMTALSALAYRFGRRFFPKRAIRSTATRAGSADEPAVR